MEKEKKVKKERRQKKEKEIIFVEDRGYYLNNGKIDNMNELVDTLKKGHNRFLSKSSKFWTGFKKFIAKGSVVEIAVALAITTAFNALVNALVSSFINPLVGKMLGTISLKDLKVVITPAVEANEALGIEAVPEVAITYGVFIDAFINFMVVALTLYVFVRVFIKIREALHVRELEEKIKLLNEEEKLALEKKKQQEEEEKAKALQKEKEHQELLNNINEQTNLLRKLVEQQRKEA